MSTQAVIAFRKSITDNPTLQEEIRTMADRGTFDPISYARDHGFEFTRTEFSQTVAALRDQFNDFELRLMARVSSATPRLTDLEVRNAERVKGGSAPLKSPNQAYA